MLRHKAEDEAALRLAAHAAAPSEETVEEKLEALERMRYETFLRTMQRRETRMLLAGLLAALAIIAVVVMAGVFVIGAVRTRSVITLKQAAVHQRITVGNVPIDLSDMKLDGSPAQTARVLGMVDQKLQGLGNPVKVSPEALRKLEAAVAKGDFTEPGMQSFDLRMDVSTSSSSAGSVDPEALHYYRGIDPVIEKAARASRIAAIGRVLSRMEATVASAGYAAPVPSQ